MCYSRLQLPYLVFRRRFCGTATTCSVSPNGKRNSEKENVIVISGPTGAGKSRIALELAKGLNGKIISADSFEVYRGLDVGSARPSATDRKVKTSATYCVICTFVYVHSSYCLSTSGAEGVLSEARWLLDLGLLPNTSSDTRAIGDRQAMEYLLNVVDKWV
ncbi:hypothetical protein Bca52824_095732 [Brassica carinata]|uniref:Uncharacterized protein n=1 Tax=Brassica carinata TaxID=52824 RepID=A0A8X7NZR0_BRACI|nr:hypothetical protein Bca52824_095732 [Brassica carinata]